MIPDQAFASQLMNDNENSGWDGGGVRGCECWCVD